MKNKIKSKILAKFVVLLLIVTFSSSNVLTAQAAIPVTGKPGSTATEKNEDGTPKQERTYGSDGRAEKDVDYNHGGNHEFPHEHDWDWSKEPPRQPGKPIPPTPCPTPSPSQGANPPSTSSSSSNSGDAIKSASAAAVAGTILYFIISEGSRIVLPVRNLIPIP